MPGTRKSDSRFLERADLLDFLLEVSALTSETLDLDRLLSSVADVIQEVAPCQLLAIMLYSERAQGLRIRHAIGHRPEVVKNLLVKLNEGITGAAAASREPVLVGDVLSDPRYLPVLDSVRSELAVPMVAQGKLVGVIDLQSTAQNAYTDRDVALLRLIASRVAFSIDNARLHRRVVSQNRTLRTLREISQEFSSILSLDDLLKKIAESVRELIDYDSFSILLLDPARNVLRPRFSLHFDERVDEEVIPLGTGITGAAAVSRQPVCVNDIASDPRYVAVHPEICSEVAVPLLVQDRLIGVIDLESARLGNFTEDDVRMLTLLAPQIATSIENARLYEEIALRESRLQADLQAGREVQQLLLPRAVDIEGLESGVRFRPAREITGDIFDCFDYADSHTGIAFGDSSGKGAAAALYGALMSGLLRTLAPRRRTPGKLALALHEALMERPVGARYVTMLLFLWNAQRREFVITNAGAVPPLLVRDGKLVNLRPEGFPLGLLPNAAYDEFNFQAAPGDVMLLVSDGIPDQEDTSGEAYGQERLEACLVRNAGLPAQALVEAVLADVDGFSRGAAQMDDQTVIALKVK